MYEWRVQRAIAGVLLCLPLVHFAYIAARDINAYLDPSPAVWDGEIARYARQDLASMVPATPVLVTGGQRVRLWRDLPDRLPGKDTLMRPLGDATLEDLTHHYDRLIGFYRPKVLVLFPGYGDLHLRDEKSPEEFQRALRELLVLDESYDTAEQRFVIAPLQMPLHPEDAQRISRMTELARDLEGELPSLTVIDANPMLSGPNGRPNPAFYRGDGINLSAEGYARVSLLLETAMRADGLITAQTQTD
jgi:hypothetical protein